MKKKLTAFLCVAAMVMASAVQASAAEETPQENEAANQPATQEQAGGTGDGNTTEDKTVEGAASEANKASTVSGGAPLSQGQTNAAENPTLLANNGNMAQEVALSIKDTEGGRIQDGIPYDVPGGGTITWNKAAGTLTLDHVNASANRPIQLAIVGGDITLILVGDNSFSADGQAVVINCTGGATTIEGGGSLALSGFNTDIVTETVLNINNVALTLRSTGADEGEITATNAVNITDATVNGTNTSIIAAAGDISFNGKSNVSIDNVGIMAVLSVGNINFNLAKGGMVSASASNIAFLADGGRITLGKGNAITQPDGGKVLYDPRDGSTIGGADGMAAASATVSWPKDDIPAADKSTTGEVQTGDGMTMGLWAVLMLLAAAGAVVALRKRTN